MKEYYTQQEMKRIITLEAVKIISQNQDALLTNSSYGTDFYEVVGVETYNELTRWFVGLERVGDWDSSKYSLVVVKRYKHETIEKQEIMTVYKLHTRKGYMYFASEEPIKKYYARYKMTPKDKTMIVKKESELAKKLIVRIEDESGHKIKVQDLIVIKSKHGYIIKYIYRKQKYTLSLKLNY